MSIRLTVPAVAAFPNIEQARQAFCQQTLAAAGPGGGVALAPMAGSRVTAFRELDLDRLVALDWSEIGNSSEIVEAFRNQGTLQQCLREAAQSSMHSQTVMSAPLAAQLMARLHREMGVEEVTLQRFSTPEGPLARLGFDFQGRPRDLWLVTHSIQSDRLGSLPVPTLTKLAPAGYDWSYHSADGLAFFSAQPDNGLEQGSQQLLDLLRPQGGVILDYPQSPGYQGAGQCLGGITFMAGRRPLEQMGLRLALQLAPTLPIFGYAGLHQGDEVRIYRKPGQPSQPSQLGDLGQFEALGPVESYQLLPSMAN